MGAIGWVDLRNLRRTAPSAAPALENAGWLPEHAPDVTLNMKLFSFSFQIEIEAPPGGFAEFNGENCKMQFPQVMVWRPGFRYRFKSMGRIETLYFSYSAARCEWAESMLDAFGIGSSALIYKLRLTALMREMIEDAKNFLADIHGSGNPDRLDRLAERMIFESLAGSSRHEPSREYLSSEYKVRQIAAEIDAIPATFNMELALKKHNLSRRSFFRAWNQLFSISPKQYVIQQRLQIAMAMLAAGSSVKDVAGRTGFCDIAHFSTSFKRHFKASPSEAMRENSIIPCSPNYTRLKDKGD